METNPAYELLRTLASPVCALTSSEGGSGNGMILDSAVRGSISPTLPRLGVYVHRWHLSHGMVARTGRFVLHLLHRGQLDLVHRFGFRSGREGDKLGRVAHRLTGDGVPLLDDHWCAFECRVANTMDGGAATFFLADVTATHRGPGTDLMGADWLRANLPEAWREEFLRNYADAQERIARLGEIRDVRAARE